MGSAVLVGSGVDVAVGSGVSVGSGVLVAVGGTVLVGAWVFVGSRVAVLVGAMVGSMVGDEHDTSSITIASVATSKRFIARPFYAVV